jgi:aminopeptidase N
VADRALEQFYADWQAVPQVVDKWLAVQAASRRPDTLQRVMALTGHPAFSLRNPNKVYALLRTYSQANPARFHAGTDTAGYRFMAEQILAVDALNPQVAARLAGVFNDWQRYAEPYRSAMRSVLKEMRGRQNLSVDVYEIVTKCLSD